MVEHAYGAALAAVGVACLVGCSSGDSGKAPLGDGGTADAASGDGASTGGRTSVSTGGAAGARSTGGAANPGGGGTTNRGTGGSGGGTSGSGGKTSTGGATGSGGAATGTGACGKSGAATGTLARVIDVGGTSRNYALSVPAPYDATVPRRVVFGYHGSGGSGDAIRGYLDLESHGGSPAIFVYPDGVGGVWDLTANGVDVAMFDAVMAKLAGEYCLDASHVFAAGFSYGGWMAEAIGCFRGDHVAGIAPVAGGGPQGRSGCKGPVPVWIAHGKADGAEPISSSESSRDYWIGKNGCTTTTAAVDPAPCVSYAGCGDGTPVVWCAHENGHEWPSFAPAGVWNFFESL